ncbi:MAG TPA: baseplate J/gp47 family protein [Vicinamibacterales bacterium]|nr:baseplate J/gp47 family protein [Vicinamibacterales bacterium]
MPLTVPTLDDRTFADLVEEGFRIVESGDGEWTNRNPSDPGVTLLELFAFVTETLIFRVNQITEEDRLAFARLLAPATDSSETGAERLDDAVRSARLSARVVSCSDYEIAAQSIDPQRIARAHCVPNRDLTRDTVAARAAVRPGHVTVLIVPRDPADSALPQLLTAVKDHLEPRRLLTTRVHVGTPEFVDIGVRLVMTVDRGASTTNVRQQIEAALVKFFDAGSGGSEGKGWPLGRAVFVSEIYRLLDQLPGVDYVSPVADGATGNARDELVASGVEPERDAAGALVALRLHPHQIPRARPGDHDLQVQAALGEIDRSR